MPKTRRDRLNRVMQQLTVPAVAGMLIVGPGALLAAPPAVDFAPQPRQGDDDEEGPVLLTDREQNLIRVYEVDLDTEPRVIIDREVLEAFLEDPSYEGRDGMPRGRDEIRAFMRWEGWKQLELFFDMRAREYYGDAEVREEPESLRTWQRINARYINQYFLRMFADKDLGEDVQLAFQGRPIDQIPLIGQGRDSDAIAYTNFYILSQMTANNIPFIDRNNPEESILIQWGLPREDAKFDAPEVEGWEPRFRGMEDDDPRRDLILEWVPELIGGNQNSRYGIEYLPPQLRTEEEE